MVQQSVWLGYIKIYKAMKEKSKKNIRRKNHGLIIRPKVFKAGRKLEIWNKQEDERKEKESPEKIRNVIMGVLGTMGIHPIQFNRAPRKIDI